MFHTFDSEIVAFTPLDAMPDAYRNYPREAARKEIGQTGGGTGQANRRSAVRLFQVHPSSDTIFPPKV
jgi:hypothetical protein